MEKFLTKIMKKLRLPNKNKKEGLMSCVLCMILVVLASQSRVFDFLIENNLGRMGLLALVLTICCTSKVFGAASVLFLVLAFAVHMNSSGGSCMLCGDNPCMCNKEGMCGGKKKEGMCGGKKKEGMCGDKKKEGMCGGKKKESFGNMSKEDRLQEERELQQGKPSHNDTVKKSGSCGAIPHESIESDFGSSY